jgi:hypothetical protein
VTAIPEATRDPVETRFAGPWLIPDRDYLSFVGRLFAAASALSGQRVPGQRPVA